MLNISTYVESLSDKELFNQLKKYGYPVGPIVDSTRKLYKRKLLELIEKERSSGDQKASTRKERKGRRFDGDGKGKNNTLWKWTETEGNLKNHHNKSVYTLPLKGKKKFLQTYEENNLAGNSDHEDEILFRKQRVFPNEYISNQIRGVPNNVQHHAQQGSTMYRNTETKKLNFITWPKFWMLVILGMALLFALYAEWQRNDPYKKVEEDLANFLDEIEGKHKIN